MLMSCTQCGTYWCWGCGMMGKGVHHVSACTRKPDPSWKFEAEERRVLDGSLAMYVEDFTLRAEQLSQLDGVDDDADAAEAHAHLAASCTPASLRPTLRRALRVLRWAPVWLYFGGGADATAQPRARLALKELAACTDILLDACNYGGEPDTAALARAESQDRVEWLVACLLFILGMGHAAPAAPH